MSEDTRTPRSASMSGGDPNRMDAVRPDKDAVEGGGRFKGKRRRKVSYLTVNKIDTVDYKEIQLLRRFINDRGKILASRQTGTTAKQQRMVAEAIRRAREMALLPFVVKEMGSDRREYGPRRERGPRPQQTQVQAPEAAPQAAETPSAE